MYKSSAIAFWKTLKPRHIQPLGDDARFSYIVDLYNLWYRNFFYFCAKYRCPALNCMSEFFEMRYTRLEYIAKDTFTMAYMRHTGKWQVVFTGLSLDEFSRPSNPRESSGRRGKR